MGVMRQRLLMMITMMTALMTATTTTTMTAMTTATTTTPMTVMTTTTTTALMTAPMTAVIQHQTLLPPSLPLPPLLSFSPPPSSDEFIRRNLVNVTITKY